MSDLDEAAVQGLARHCRLALTGAQVADHRERLAPLVTHLERLAAVDTRGVAAYTPPGPAGDLRDDSPGACLAVDEALAGAQRRGEFVVVPRRRRSPPT